MGAIDLIVNLFGAYSYLLYFIAGLFTGEAGIVFLMVLVVHGTIPFLPMILLFLLGALVIDIVIYIIATKGLSKLKKYHLISKGSEKLGMVIDKYVRGNEFYAILIAKFLQGTNLVLLVYLSVEKLDYKKYIKYDLLATLIWITEMAIIGWLVGQGFKIVLTVFKSIQLAILFLIVVLVILYFIQKWLDKKFKSEIKIK
ncbi:hypothetical protein COU62_03255 [Candidatus Pacearchaeota archaeon CG10_big_fil_rev_8_21_14_0_10_35_219]|nr:hypothetical protein [Candidatus Pacearchaeota archaeon]OIO42392.1 MAG: hypothetical protein AUJ63_03910 [Candidatus Pacearchaeota archaeon CG1_02_35_32]PIO07373.1 MAG: hypothetical protein COU62_03255 [Candidatus Pacearchaeota archaeon CG10_big_fil_rev_8_21_14_0_10_35_219]PIY81700.1 MAG: hypothetical protein COY79_01340 [Candidatus Pacearchaeota archaeon CG_4_10_14_0_8_um_filter_35_169]PIZ79518.1 MAG: hypothetical protein COY00_03805 [Candidatus Pacearchaeota archaeon CG_4_10_14_0_2_um_filt